MNSEPTPELTPRTVMVVDDDLEIRETLAMMLHDFGYSVRTAMDGQDALNILGDVERPGVILLDLTMPVMDGGTLLARLDGDPRYASIPVVILTAMPEHAPRSVGRVLAKPIDFEVVLDLVQKHCGPVGVLNA